jgi:hypothetical protein
VLHRAQSRQHGLSPNAAFLGGKVGLIVRTDCGDIIVEHRIGI